MQFHAHDYQKYTIDFIRTHPAAAAFLDCGLGKTVICLTALKDLLEAANGKTVLVVYSYRHDLTRISAMLRDKGYLFSRLDSKESIRAWNRGELQAGLINPQSAGHGLNLQEGGNQIIWYSLPWSLEMYQQTNARLWRQGQKCVADAAAIEKELPDAEIKVHGLIRNLREQQMKMPDYARKLVKYPKFDTVMVLAAEQLKEDILNGKESLWS